MSERLNGLTRAQLDGAERVLRLAMTSRRVNSAALGALWGLIAEINEARTVTPEKACTEDGWVRCPVCGESYHASGLLKPEPTP